MRRNNVWDGLGNDEMAEIDELIGPSMGKSPRRTEVKEKKAGPVNTDGKNLRGVIVHYNFDTGFGFIKRDDTGENVYFRSSAFRESKQIFKEFRVSFDLYQIDKTGRTSAINARVLR